MKLHHLALPNLTSYSHASFLQNHIVSRFLANKASPNAVPAPLPVILTAQFHPVYTAGRREINALSDRDIAHLRAGGAAEFHYAQRGGQTTFHGPGQLVAYPILDLRRHGLSPKGYVHLLEEVLIATCGRYGVKAFRTENTGVWTSSENKIAAIGVHLRRHITSHGVGLNVSTDLGWFERIVACGLEGKGSTSLEHEGLNGLGVEEVGRVFVDEFAERIEKVDGVKTIEEDAIEGWDANKKPG